MAGTDYRTVAEVADYLRVSVWTVRRLVAAGSLGDVLKADGPNGSIRIPVSGINAYIASHTVTAEETR